MAECHQECWDDIISKYGNRNIELQRREEELIQRVEAMQALLNESGIDLKTYRSISEFAYQSEPTLETQYPQAQLPPRSSRPQLQVRSPSTTAANRQFPVEATRRIPVVGESTAQLTRQQGQRISPQRSGILAHSLTLHASSSGTRREAESSAPNRGFFHTILNSLFSSGSANISTTTSNIAARKTEAEISTNKGDKNVPCCCAICPIQNDCCCQDNCCNCDNTKVHGCGCSYCKLGDQTLCPCDEGETVVHKKPPDVSDCEMNSAQNMQMLMANQKQLNKNITQLERKDKIFGDALKQHKIGADGENLRCICALDKNHNQIQMAELRLENLILKNELKDMRLEVRQYLERMEGPMQFKIESEKYKCIKLEEQLEQQSAQLAEIQQLFQSELNSLKMELLCANSNIINLRKMNEDLNIVKENLLQRAQQLEDDLIRQKLSDFETIKRLNESLDETKKKTATPVVCRNLHDIAQDLSDTLQAAVPCDECARLPSDMNTTVEYIKELADLVDAKLPPQQRGEPYRESKSAAVPKTPSSVQTLSNIPQKPKTTSISAPRETSKISLSMAPTATVTPATHPPKEEPPVPGKSTASPRPTLDGLNRSTGSTTKISSAATLSIADVVEPIKQGPLRKEDVWANIACKCGQRGKKEGDEDESKQQQTFSPKCRCQQPQPERACKCSRKKPIEITPSSEFRKQKMVDMSKPKIEQNASSRPGESTKGINIPRNFPYDVEAATDVMDKPPTGVYVTTTITKEGLLEINTEGPDGAVATNLVYTPSGNVEVVSEILPYNVCKTDKCTEQSKKATLKLLDMQHGPQCACPTCQPSGSKF